jgi:AAA+ superfamily predicted ATPase
MSMTQQLGIGSGSGNGVGAPKTEQQVLEEALLDTLGQLGGQRITDDALIREGRQLVLPETMTPKDAIAYLEDYVEQQEEETRFDRVFRFRPWDGAYALQNALVKVFGTAGIGKPTYTFFGKTPPKMRSINIGVDRTTQVPWGELEVPLFKGTMYLDLKEDEEFGPLFHLVIDAARKYRAHIEGLFNVVETELRSGSIYKGQAIDGKTDPEFVDLSGIDPSKVVYSDEVMAQLNANVWSLLLHSETMRGLGLPLKRAVLLEGPFGTGKTLAAFLTAQVAVKNGWTFIYCRPGRDDLAKTMATARLYQPSVVFFEDIDVQAESGERVDVTRLLDLFDGITAKGTEIMAVLTTNHAEAIHKGMLRPGRLDSMIHIGALDVSGVQKMIEAVVDDWMLGDDLDFEAIYEAMKGFLPAFVKESIDRTLRYAVSRTGGVPTELTTEDFVHAANGLRPQLDLMEDAEEGKHPESLDAAVRRTVRDATEGSEFVSENGGVLPSGKLGKLRHEQDPARLK